MLRSPPEKREGQLLDLNRGGQVAVQTPDHAEIVEGVGFSEPPRFRALAALSARQDAKQRFKTLDDALELWRGPALADVSGPEAVAAAAALEHQLGGIHAGQSRPASAIRHYNRSLRLFHELGDDLRKLYVRLSLANVEVQAGNLESGLERLRRCLESFHGHGDRYGVAKTLTGLGIAHLSAGRGSEAAAILEDAAQRWAALGPAYATHAQRCRAALVTRVE